MGFLGFYFDDLWVCIGGLHAFTWRYLGLLFVVLLDCLWGLCCLEEFWFDYSFCFVFAGCGEFGCYVIIIALLIGFVCFIVFYVITFVCFCVVFGFSGVVLLLLLVCGIVLAFVVVFFWVGFGLL